LGKVIKPLRKTKPVVIPNELKVAFISNTALKNAFKSLSPYCQREYCEYITGAKREDTKQRRLDKITPMVINRVGLNDKYK